MQHLDLIRTPEQAGTDDFIVRSVGSVPFPLLRLSKAHFLPQTRGTVTAGDVSGLWPGMVVAVEMEESTVELIQPPTVGIFTTHAMEKYLQLLTEFWESDDGDVEMSSIYHEEGQRFSAVIAGHRRLTAIPIAVAHATGVKNRSHDSIWVPVNTIHDPDYIHGLQTQYRENAHKLVPLWQEADVITRTRRWLGDKKNQISFTELADYLGITPERVSNAVRFTALPRYIQDYVAEGILRSSDALELETIGSSLGFRLLKEKISGDELTTLETRLRANQLRLWDVLPLIEERELEQTWQDMLQVELTRISGRSKDQVSQYAASIREAQLSSRLFADGALTESDPRNGVAYQQVKAYKDTRRKEVAAQLLQNMRGLLAAIDEDLVQVRRAETVPELELKPVLAASHRAGVLWTSIDTTMQDILDKKLPSGSLRIDALTAVVENLGKFVCDLQSEEMLAADNGEIRYALAVVNTAIVNNLVGTHDQIAPLLSAIRAYVRVDTPSETLTMFDEATLL